MKREPTPEQRAVIDERGSIIVSASAGSGKTYVMIERLVSFILAGEDVRRLLAVTFTNNAAAQMRDRLREALLKAIADPAHAPDRERLKEQLTHLPLAQISTIHAFCGRLVRTYFYLVGTDPAFRIIDPKDAEGMAISARALDAALERMYDSPSPEFSLLLSVYFKRGSDAELRTQVTKLYASVRDFAEYRAVIGRLGQSTFEEVCGCLASDVRARAAELARVHGERRETLIGVDGGNLEQVMEEMTSLAQEASAGDLFEQREAWGAMRIPMRATGKKGVPAHDRTPEQQRAVEYYNAMRGAVKEIKEFLAGIKPREEERDRFDRAARLAAAFCGLLLAYDEELEREKREAGVLDYSDLEQYALRILDDERVRGDLREHFRVLFVDEYQDVNPVQDAILSRLAGGEAFYVGDAKQAIYGFRGSSSDFCLRKTKTETCLTLSQNFRSAKSILDAANEVFRPLFESYRDMRVSERYREHEGKVTFHVLERGEKPAPAERGVYSVTEQPASAKRDAFAERAAKLVEEELGSAWFDVDADCEKRIRPGDIAVLCRSHAGEARIARALLARGIPVTTSAKVNLCEFFEARLLLDWLSYLDNPEQDIPLVTALLSFVGGMTEEELAEVRRAQAGSESFRAACLAYCAQQPASPVAGKLNAFFARAQELRIHACVRTAADLMNELLALGLEVQIAAKEGGNDRLTRVRRLVAEGEDVSVNTFLSRLRASGNKLEFAPSAGENAVQVITIHASKGLEYPVVFLTQMNDTFQFSDENKEIVFTKQFLAAPKSYNAQNKTYTTNLLRIASFRAERKEECSQECNLLYVAMTRAKYRLHVLLKSADCGQISPMFVKTYAGFLNPDLVNRSLGGEVEMPADAPARRALAHGDPDPEMTAAVLDVYCKPYRYASSTRLRAKSSATDLLNAQRGEFLHRAAAGLFDEGEVFTGKTSREAGTAHHVFLQHVRYGADAGEEFARMVREGILTPEQAGLLNVEELREILRIPALSSLADKQVLREQTFLMRLPASAVAEDAPDDEVIFQGAIDLLVQGKDGCEVIDYKYSMLPDEVLAQKYAVQIRLYKMAAARVLRVREETIRASIVNLALRREIVL